MTNAELIAALRYCPSHGCGRCVALGANGRCTAHGVVGLMNQAADIIEAQQKALDACAKQLADMAAKLPKEGEWIDDNGANVPLDRDGYTTGMCRCSVCNDWLIASDEYEVRGRYCPNCGARMKGEQE